MTGYAVRHREYNNNDDWTERALASTDTTTTITGLTNGIEYEVQVRASNARGDSAWSESATVTPQTHLAAPAGFTAPPTSTGAHSVRWEPVPGATRYDLDVRHESETTWTTYNTGELTQKDFTALDEGAWTYRVRACDGQQCAGLERDPHRPCQCRQCPCATRARRYRRERGD